MSRSLEDQHWGHLKVLDPRNMYTKYEHCTLNRSNGSVKVNVQTGKHEDRQNNRQTVRPKTTLGRGI